MTIYNKAAHAANIFALRPWKNPWKCLVLARLTFLVLRWGLCYLINGTQFLSEEQCCLCFNWKVRSAGHGYCSLIGCLWSTVFEERRPQFSCTLSCCLTYFVGLQIRSIFLCLYNMNAYFFTKSYFWPFVKMSYRDNSNKCLIGFSEEIIQTVSTEVNFTYLNSANSYWITAEKKLLKFKHSVSKMLWIFV